MDVIESLEWRYATKKFDDKFILDSNHIKQLSKAFNLTATSYGLQPIKLKIVKNKALQTQMEALAFGQQQVSTASHVLVFCIENKVDKQFIDAYFEIVNNVRHLKEASNSYHKVLVDRFSEKTETEIKDWAVKQAYLALGNLLTVCAFYQIDSCPMEGFIPSKVDELLGLAKENLSSVLLLPIGKRADDDKNSSLKKVRRPIAQTVEVIE